MVSSRTMCCDCNLCNHIQFPFSRKSASLILISTRSVDGETALQMNTNFERDLHSAVKCKKNNALPKHHHCRLHKNSPVPWKTVSIIVIVFRANLKCEFQSYAYLGSYTKQKIKKWVTGYPFFTHLPLWVCPRKSLLWVNCSFF